jgi:hypothetical protein
MTSCVRGALLALLAVAWLTSPAAAFGLDDVISDFLYYREALRADGARPQPVATLFLDGTYNMAGDRRDLEHNRQQSYGGEVGVLARLHEIFLAHASFRGLGFDNKFQFDGDEFRSSGRFIEVRLGGDLIYLDSKPLKAWLTLEGAFFNTEVAGGRDSSWVWNVGPSTTLSWRLGDVLLEPTVGVRFLNTFDRGTTHVTLLEAGFAAKYRGERWRPQLNFAYSKLFAEDVKDDGAIAVGPELTYAVTPSLLLGIGYTYSTPVDRAIHVESHTATLRLRWTF